MKKQHPGVKHVQSKGNTMSRSVYPTSPVCKPPQSIAPSIDGKPKTTRRYPTEALQISSGLKRDVSGRFIAREKGSQPMEQNSQPSGNAYPCGHAGQRLC